MNHIPLSAADITDIEHDALSRVAFSGWVAPAGPDLDLFETEVAERAGAAFGVALSSGSAALHLALLTAGVTAGSIVPTSTLTFAATTNAIVAVGATPYFVDSDPTTGNIDVDLLEAALDQLIASGQRVGAIVPVDIYGKAAEHASIQRVAEVYGIPVISDSAESMGATHAGRPVGTFGTTSITSFNGNKIMTASGGGMLFTDDEEIAARARILSSQGRQPGAHYLHSDVGFNYKMSNVLAALGRAQLTRLDEMIASRRAIRDRYRQMVAPFDVTILGGDDDQADNCWLTSIILGPDCELQVDDIVAALAVENIESRQLWRPMHTQPVYRGQPGMTSGAAERLFERGLSLPSGSGLSDSDIERVCAVVSRTLEAAHVPA